MVIFQSTPAQSFSPIKVISNVSVAMKRLPFSEYQRANSTKTTKKPPIPKNPPKTDHPCTVGYPRGRSRLHRINSNHTHHPKTPQPSPLTRQPSPPPNPPPSPPPPPPSPPPPNQTTPGSPADPRARNPRTHPPRTPRACAPSRGCRCR